MASKSRRDVVARLVSKKLRSRIYIDSSSGSEEDSLGNEKHQVEEKGGFESIQEKAGRCKKEDFESIQEKAGQCKHGPPTDYPCHLCCHQKWVSTRKLDQPLLVGRGNSRGQGHVLHKGGSEQLSGDVKAKSKKKERDHSEENQGDHADILFDGITVRPKTKKANNGMNIAGKGYSFNVPPGVTITAGGPLKSKTSSTSNSAPNDVVITPISSKEATITTDSPPLKTNSSSTPKEDLVITPTSTKEASLYEEIEKKTNWAEFFCISRVSVLGKPVPVEDEVIVEGEFKSDKAVEDWECSFCTFINSGDEDQIRCNMCQKKRKSGQVEGEGEGAGDDLTEMKKQCPFCTLLNLPHCMTCAACEGILN